MICSLCTRYGFALVPIIPCGPKGAAASEKAERNRAVAFIRLLRQLLALAVAVGHTAKLPPLHTWRGSGILNWTGPRLFLPAATAGATAARGAIGLGAGFALVSAATTGKVDGGGRFTPGRHEHARRRDGE